MLLKKTTWTFLTIYITILKIYWKGLENLKLIATIIQKQKPVNSDNDAVYPGSLYKADLYVFVILPSTGKSNV